MMNFGFVNVLASADAAAPGAAGALGGLGGFIPLILLFAIMYFLLIRPQQRKEKERQKIISELRVGQRVMFAGGIVGNVVEAREHTFLIEISPGVKIEVARGAVSRVLTDGETVRDA